MSEAAGIVDAGDHTKVTKPWYRTRNLVLAVFAVLLLLSVKECVWAFSAKPGDGSMARAILDAALDEHVGPFDDESSVGDDLIRAAASEWAEVVFAVESEVEAELVEALGEDQMYEITNEWAMTWNWPDVESHVGNTVMPERVRAAADEMIARYEESAGAILDQIVTTQNFRHELTPGPLISGLLPNLGASRRLARLQAGRVRLASEAGDWDAMVREFERGMALGRVTAHEPFLISRLVSDAIWAHVLERVRQQVTARGEGLVPGGPIPAAVIAELEAVVDRQAVRPPMTLTMAGEQGFVIDMIDRSTEDDGNGGGRFLLHEYSAITGQAGFRQVPGGGVGKVRNLAGLVLPGRRELLDTAGLAFGYSVRMAELTVRERADVDAALAERDWEAAELDALPHGVPEPFDVGTLAPTHFVLRMWGPALGRAFDADDQMAATLAGTRALLAVERFRSEQGRLPADLDELESWMGSTLERDPRDVTDQPWTYLTDPGVMEMDPAGRAYLLYSPLDMDVEAIFAFAGAEAAGEAQSGRGFREMNSVPPPDTPGN